MSEAVGEAGGWEADLASSHTAVNERGLLAPREWELSKDDLTGRVYADGPLLDPGAPVVVVERASLDRVVEERDELAQLVREARAYFALLGTVNGREWCEHIDASAVLRSGEGERHEG